MYGFTESGKTSFVFHPGALELASRSQPPGELVKPAPGLLLGRLIGRIRDGAEAFIPSTCSEDAGPGWRPDFQNSGEE